MLTAHSDENITSSNNNNSLLLSIYYLSFFWFCFVSSLYFDADDNINRDLNFVYRKRHIFVLLLLLNNAKMFRSRRVHTNR